MFNIKNCKINDLWLQFTLPGYDDVQLVENGSDKVVTIENLDEYVELCSKYFLLETVRYQISTFREAFQKVRKCNKYIFYTIITNLYPNHFYIFFNLGHTITLFKFNRK